MAEKKKKNDLRTKSVEDLKKHAIELKREMMNLRFQKAAGELDKTHRFKEIRREVARIKTHMSVHAKKVMEK
jgi:large subunit ribosomal protein L29